MKDTQSKNIIKKILDIAEIEINGKRKFDIQINDERFYDRVLNGGTLALGESYMDGWWDCEDLATFFFKIQNRKVSENLLKNKKLIAKLLIGNWKLISQIIFSKLFNMQTKIRSKQVIKEHYDIGNELFINA